uniref:tRNA-5-taurinomethyluridine 2-sulfurtransferase n=1 Tax=Psilocybe cubensis TaxID=181762 RepID=A0A8H8CMH4_PSICU
MSGGVDSSVAAMLLAQKDYNLSAVYMRNWDTRDESGTDKGCEWEKDWEDVQLVCKKLDLPCELIDLTRDYWNRVFEPSLRQWEYGVSPNPDVWCNKEIKFGALLEKLPQKDAWFATGHYARKSWTENGSRPKLLRAADSHKDQTYFLSSISEAGLSRALFPLAHLTKPEIRELARKNNLSTAERPDSVGICFVGEKRRFNDFLDDYIPPNPGNIVDRLNGKVIGEHGGLWHFTIGQNVRVSGMPQKMFVVQKDIEKNEILVVPGSTHESLFTRTINVCDFDWIWTDTIPEGIDSSDGVRLSVMHRYRMQPVECSVRRQTNEQGSFLVIECDELQHAVCPGQAAVLYLGNWCLGSGTIVTTS